MNLNIYGDKINAKLPQNNFTYWEEMKARSKKIESGKTTDSIFSIKCYPTRLKDDHGYGHDVVFKH